MQREPVVAPTVVVTEIAVCFVPSANWFVVRAVVRIATAEGDVVTDIVSSPLSRRQFDADTGGPELAEFLMAHPGSWWRVPKATDAEEGDGL